jgi:hypothetical protein
VFAVAAAASHGGKGHRVTAPRQLNASAAVDDGSLLGGVSSFAFQGTNAHAILGKQLSSGSFSLPGASAAFLVAARVQRARYWVLPSAHPFIGGGSVSWSGSARTLAFECNLSVARLALYSDHQVFGRVLFPGAAMMEAVLAAGVTTADSISTAVLAVSGMAISSPVIIPHPSQQRPGGVLLRCSLHPAAGDFQLSQAEQHSKHTVESAHGRLASASASAAVAMSIHATVVVAAAVAVMQRMVTSKLLSAAAVNVAGNATGSIEAPHKLTTDGYLVPPPCMDACLHLGVAAPRCGAKVPVAVGSFLLADRKAAAGTELAGSTSAAYRVPVGSTDNSSFALLTGAGGAFASLGGLETKVTKAKAVGAAAAAASVKPADFLYEVDWEAASEPAVNNGSQHGAKASLSLGSCVAALGLHDGPQLAAASALSVLQLAQAAQFPALAARLPEVLPAGRPSPHSSHSRNLLTVGAVEGLLRVAATEHATAAYNLSVLDSLAATGQTLPAGDSHAADTGTLNNSRLHNAVVAAPRLLPRCEIARRRLRAPCLSACRSATIGLPGQPVTLSCISCPVLCSRSVAPAAELLQIRPLPRGSLASLASQPFEIAAAAATLKPYEVLVAVKAVGINFRDVLNVLGMYPGDPGPPGSDCAGLVIHAGAASTFKPGTNQLLGNLVD